MVISQGGMENEYYDVDETNKLKTFTYPIAFQNLPIYIEPIAVHYEISDSLSFPRVLQREITNSNFKLYHTELNRTTQKVKLSYIAIGV